MASAERPSGKETVLNYDAALRAATVDAGEARVGRQAA
jgi:hypothetical protein